MKLKITCAILAAMSSPLCPTMAIFVSLFLLYKNKCHYLLRSLCYVYIYVTEDFTAYYRMRLLKQYLYLIKQTINSPYLSTL
jgi:hypothetical protein